MQTVKFWCPSSQIYPRFVYSALLIAGLSWCVCPSANAADGATAIEQLRAHIMEHGVKDIHGQPFAKLSLSAPEANKAAEIVSEARLKRIRTETQEEFDNRELQIGELKMPFWFEAYGDAPSKGHSLYISMHGGGGAPKRVNDQQWENQKRLYKPDEGIYVAPRAPTDTWNLWHQAHIDEFYDRLIEMMVAHRNVNPNRVYIMGYSAGGDGVYQLAPRMADRLAAAAMMAGHPNETKPDGLRNIGFTLFMGGKDAAYKRNKIAADWKEKLAALKESDPGGYEHEVTIFPEFGHWMQRKDAVGVPWMAKFSRQQWPNKIVWLQDDVTHSRFYWLEVPNAKDQSRKKITATCDGQDIVVQSESPVTLLLSDELLNLEQPINVTLNGQKREPISATRTIGSIAESIAKYGVARPVPTATAELTLAP